MNVSALEATQSLIALLSGEIFHRDGLSRALQGICRIGRELLGADIATVFALNPVTGSFLSAPVTTDLLGVDLSTLSSPRPGGLTRQVMETRFLFVEDLATAAGEPFGSGFTDAAGVRSFAAVALPTTPSQQVLAVLYLDYREKRAFAAADRDALQFFADQAALILQNLWLFESLRRVTDTGQLLTQDLNSEQVLGSVVEWIRRAAEADVCVLYPWDRGAQSFVVPPKVGGDLFEPDFPQPTVSRPDDVASLLFRQPEPHFVPNSSDLYERIGGDPTARLGNFEQREGIRSTAALPLDVGGERVGVLFLNYRNPQRFEEPQKQVIQSLASFAAIAIRNSGAFKALEEEQLRRLKILREIEREISSTLDSQQVLQTIVDQSRQAVRADEASILLYNQRTGALETKVASGPHRKENVTTVLPPGAPTGIVGWVFAHGKPVRVADVDNDPSWQDVYAPVLAGIVSELDVPLLDDHEVLGVMNFESRTPDAFDQADEDFLVTLAEHAVLAIRNAQAYERAKRIADENEALINIAKKITTELRLGDIFDFILEQARILTRASTAEFLIYDAEEGDLLSVASIEDGVGLQGRRQPPGQGIIGWVAQNRKPFHDDIGLEPWSRLYLPHIPTTRSEMAVPLLGRDRSLRGVLDVESREPHRFDERDLWTLQALADLAVVAIQNLERYGRSEAMAERLRALHHVVKQIIGQADDPAQAIDSILRSALELTNAETADLHLYQGRETRTTYLASWSHKGRNLMTRKVDAVSEEEHQIKRGIVHRVAETREAYRTHGDAQRDRYYQGGGQVHSEVAVPLLSESNELIGVLNLESTAMGAFNDDHVEVLELFASQVVLAIQNAENRKRRDQELRRFKLLSKAGIELGKIAEMTEEQLDLAYGTVIRIAREHSDCEVVIRRLDVTKRELVAVKIADRQEMRPFRTLSIDGKNLNALVYHTHEPKVVHDVLSPQGVDVQPSDDKTRTILITPIELDRDTYYGNLALSHERPYHFIDADLELFTGLARLLALTINRLETVKLKQEAELRASAAEAMSSVGKSAFELAHRLGNYLGGIEADVEEVLQDLRGQGSLNEEIEELLREIVENVTRVLSVSRELKREVTEFRPSELRSRKPVKVKVGAVLHDALQNLPNIPSNVELERPKIKDPDVEVLLVQPVKVSDILHNLVSNAVDAMPQGGTIRIRARTTPRFVEVEVSDTGTGIPAKELPNLFHLFYSTKESTGFGLWSAQAYARATGGDLKVRSKVRRGTTFTLCLPRAESRVERS